MDEKHVLETARGEIDAEDWEKTPASVKKLVVEIPPIEVQIEEHRLHQLSCTHCGQKNRATIPYEVETSGYGERVVSLVSLLSGMYRHSHRMVVTALSDLFGVKISERSGVSQQLGRDLLAQQKKLFRLWHRVRDGTLSRTEFQSLALPRQARLKSLLEQGANYPIGYREKTPLAQSVRTCRQRLKVEPAMWLFIPVEGLEPTNNAAERAIRPAVLWRRTSFGSQSEAGSVFVSRMLTVVTSLRSQNRDVLEFMTQAVRASRQGSSPPSLLPQSSSSPESQPLAA